MQDRNFLEHMPSEIIDAICSFFSSRQSLRPLARTSKRLGAMVYLSDLAHLLKMTAEEQLHCLVTLYSTKIPWLSNTGNTNITNWLYHYLSDPAIGLLQRTVATKLLARVEDNDTHTRCVDKLMERINVISPLLGYGLRSFFDKTKIDVNDYEISRFLDFWQTPKIEFQFCLQQISNDLLQPRKEEFFKWLKDPYRKNTDSFHNEYLNHVNAFLSNLDKNAANNLLTALDSTLLSSKLSQDSNIMIYAAQAMLMKHIEEADKNKYLDAIYVNIIGGLSLIIEREKKATKENTSHVEEISKYLSVYLRTINVIMADLSRTHIENIYQLLKSIGRSSPNNTNPNNTGYFHKQRASVFASLLQKLMENNSGCTDILTDFLDSKPVVEQAPSRWKGMKLRVLREIYRELNPKQIDTVFEWIHSSCNHIIGSDQESCVTSILIELLPNSTKSATIINQMINRICSYIYLNFHTIDINHLQHLINKITAHMQDSKINKEFFSTFVDKVSLRVTSEPLTGFRLESYLEIYTLTQFLAQFTLHFSENELNESPQTRLHPGAMDDGRSISNICIRACHQLN